MFHDTRFDTPAPLPPHATTLFIISRILGFLFLPSVFLFFFFRGHPGNMAKGMEREGESIKNKAHLIRHVTYLHYL